MKYLNTISRVLIALLFVVAGVMKLTDGHQIIFSATADSIASLGVPLPIIVTALVIFIEIVVALAFAYGYKKCITGGILAVFTLLTIFVVHRDLMNGVNMIMTLKNLAIIGGILAVIGNCDCGKCPASKA